MIKKIKQEKTVTETIKEYYCDDCGKQTIMPDDFFLASFIKNPKTTLIHKNIK